MEDKQEKVLSLYNLKVKNSYRTRGAFVLETGQGLMLLREHSYIGGHFLFENRIKEALFEAGMEMTDRVIKTGDGKDFAELETGEKYVITRWFYGEECNLRNEKTVREAAENLGKMHRILANFPAGDEYIQEPEAKRLERHSREMKRVFAYMKSKKQKNEFEIFAMDCFPAFYENGMEAEEMLKGLETVSDKVCHGDYNYHNVLFTSRGIATTCFNKACRGEPLMDLYYFLRKTMEKNNWETSIGEAALNGYEKQMSLGEEGNRFLYVMLRYPEKYWKLLNQYYNRKKSWLSGRNMEKLIGVKEQTARKEKFLSTMKERCGV